LNIPEKMKAVVLMGPDHLEVRDVDVPKPGPVDVLIKVESCALCGTDVGLIKSPLPGQPPYGEHIIGHEYAGTVVALGETVDEFEIGDRVTVEAHGGCGRCRNCRLGNYVACLNYGNQKKGHRANGFTTPGGNAQYVINHINTVHKIADHVSMDEASLATNLGCVLYGIETLGGFIAGETVVIVGPGPLGLSAVQAAKALGAKQVILLGTRESRLKIAEKTGADIIVNVKEQDPYEVIMEATNGVGCDYAIESSGSESGLALSIKASKRMGKILLLGFPHKPFPADFEELALNNKYIYTVRGEGWANVGRAVSMLNRGTVDLKPLITHTYPIAEIDQAFETFNKRIDGAIKVISKPQE
jgi:L-iditol 2-dehydrogenase